VVAEAVGEHATAVLEAFADGSRIAVFEAFDDQEEHGGECTTARLEFKPRNRSGLTTRIAA
jgi:hypothetical protein